MKYIAHKNLEEEQTLKEHLQGTAKLAGDFAAEFSKEEWGYCCGMLHDIGKYSMEFQNKIINELDVMVDHATAGAKVCWEKGGYYPILSYCIAGHHAGLPDFGNTALRTSLCGRMNKSICDFHAYENEIEIPLLTKDPIEMSKDRDMNFSLSVFIRMIYSCLVDADFLDTEFFMNNGNNERDSGESMETLMKRLDVYIRPWLDNVTKETINGRRTEILRNCMSEAKQKKGLFRLTVPTGGGKTIASLAFALKHAAEHHMNRVIYVIPYTSIIEQNAQVFREILGKQNVLENHCNVEYEEFEEFNSMQLASENWDKPVVVTTNIQFFESLFANKSSKCRKLHNIANSVIVLDEAQMLPTDYLKPCLAILQELVESYHASVVLCTATQPALDNFFGEKGKIVELCPRVEEQFDFFERVIYKKLGDIKKEQLIERLNDEESALCIVNTKKLAQEIYKEIKREGVYHLSTSMYPKHRKKVLKEIRERLNKHEKCIVISTSLVEAGVDLDFMTVYRQLAGIDSVIQAAGRCNREGKRKKEDSKVYVFELQDSTIVQNQRMQTDIARSIINDYININNLEGITDCFARLYHYRGTSLDKKEIMAKFCGLECDFAKVGREFKLIEQDTQMIFIAKELEAVELLEELKNKGVSKTRMRKAGQYCVQIYGDEQERDGLFSKLQNAGIIKPLLEEMHNFYVLANKKQYSEEYGLEMIVENCSAFFM